MRSIARRERNVIVAASLAILWVGATLLRHHSWRQAAILAALLATSAILYVFVDRKGLFDVVFDTRAMEKQPTSLWRRGRAPFVLAILFLLAIAYVALTGGLLSPFFCLLYLPLLLLTIRYGAAQGLAASFVIAAAYLLAAVAQEPMRAEWLEAVSLTFPLAALFGSVFSARLAAGYRAIAARETELSTLMDVSRMLETALDLGTTVNLILINIQQLVQSDTCAIYLCKDDETLALAASTGIASGRMKPEIAASELSIDGWRLGDDRVGIVRRGEAVSTALADKGCGLVATVRGTDHLLGLLYLERDEGAFTDDEEAKLSRFAIHIGLPLQQARYRDSLEWMAFNDPMTGLANFRYFQRRLSDELLRFERYQRPLSLLILDIDHFKMFNDTRGHLAGDALLSGLGRLLKETVRQGDLAARYGGEEFVILCPETGEEEAGVIAERVRSTVERAAFGLPDYAGGAISEARATLSIGYATFPNDAITGEDLIIAADQALYLAKNAGRNCVRQAGCGSNESDHPLAPAASK